MEAMEAELLRAECTVYARALTGAAVTAYVADRYIAGHAATPHLRDTSGDAVDAMLVAAARRGPFALRCADSYARFFRPSGTLRCKLTLFLAIAENAPQMHESLNAPREAALVHAMLQVAAALAGAVAVLIVALVRFGPLHLTRRRARGVTRPAEQPAVRAVPVTAPRALARPVHHGEVER